MDRASAWEKALVVLLIVLLGLLLFRNATQEPQKRIEVVSPEETTFTPSK